MKTYGGVDVLLLLLWLYGPLLDLGHFFSFLILYTVGRASWTEDQPVRPLPTHRTTQTQIAMPRVGSVHTLDHAGTVIGGLDV
jgi:hypothetical protein